MNSQRVSIHVHKGTPGIVDAVCGFLTKGVDVVLCLGDGDKRTSHTFSAYEHGIIQFNTSVQITVEQMLQEIKQEPKND